MKQNSPSFLCCFFLGGGHLAKDLEPENRMKIIKLEKNCTILPFTTIINEVM